MSWALTLLLFFARVIPQMGVYWPGPAIPPLSAGIALVAHTYCHGSNCATSALNTTGATLLVIGKTDYSSTMATPTDSNGNTWNGLTLFANWFGNSREFQMFYAYNPTVGTSHIFYAGGSSSDSNIFVSAYSGTLTTSAVFDTQSGAGNSAQPGSITPSQTGELLVTLYYTENLSTSGPSINDGFSVLNFQPSTYPGGADGFLFDSNTSAINPTWSGGGNTGVSMASFKHP
jgi:hypothetical protein